MLHGQARNHYLGKALSLLDHNNQQYAAHDN